jgi:putative transposase
MRKSRFTESQIIKVLKEVEGGRQVNEVCREYGISDATYYNWKAKYGGMEVSDIKRLKELEEENQRLKRMFADLSLKHEALRDIVEKMPDKSGAGSALRPAEKRELVDYARDTHGLSLRSACDILRLRRSVYRYRPKPNQGPARG